MEELTISWPAISSLEPLRPLSPDVLDDDIADLGISVGKLSRSELAGKLLDHLDELTEEEAEPFDWFATEKSIDLPLFDNVHSVPSPTYYRFQNNNVKQLHNYAFQPVSPNVKNEQCMQPEYAFEPMQPQAMYPAQALHGAVTPTNTVSPVPSIDDWVKAEALTPPDSPKDEEILKLLQEIEPNELEQLAMARKLLQEMQPNELEQLVMTKMDDAPTTYSENSCSQDDFSDGASSPFVGSDSGMEDPEWSPPRSMKTTSGYSSTASSTTVVPPKRKKPYSRPAPEERKLRKKEQNKNAATRYRMKKKAEVEVVKVEETQLEEKNKALKSELDDISREVKYLKNLMRDVYRKKGLIK